MDRMISKVKALQRILEGIEEMFENDQFMEAESGNSGESV